jgi:hypothetical protein
MNSWAARTNRFVFVFFSGLLLLLQFWNDGIHAYFSMYVAKQWLCSGYLLYAAIIYLFLVYSTALFRKGQFATGGLQVLSLIMLIGVMLYPFDSINHVTILPFLAALQPIILYCDHHSRSCDDVHHAKETLRGVLMLMIVSPGIFILMFFPMVEKIMIYLVVALLFKSLQSKMMER